MTELRVNPTTCRGNGICAQIAPELISLDKWGYPILGSLDSSNPRNVTLADDADVNAARKAATRCPQLALTVTDD